jgi:acyl carrier protein
MSDLDRTAVLSSVVSILSDLREDWEYSDEITEKTGIFSDLEFESIDAVALGSAIEEHFNQSLPFAQFLTEAGERDAQDIYVGELVDFVMANLRPKKNG